MGRKKLSEIKTREDAEEAIEYYVNQRGSHSHNLVGMVLRQVDAVLGRDVANDLIDEFSLDILYGMNKEPYNGK